MPPVRYLGRAWRGEDGRVRAWSSPGAGAERAGRIPGALKAGGALVILVCGAPTALPAQSALATAADVSRVDVVGATPAPGPVLDRKTLPAATFVLEAGDIERTGIPNLTDAILATAPSATINDVEGNVFQPDILFRGFTASPVAGTPEGLAVYVNGARFNDAFGDTVNWDLIAPAAIQSATVEAANPVFGLNALGGSVTVRLKTGFTFQGQTLTAYGGSYGRRAGIFEVGRQAGPVAVYLAADITHDDGFRQTSASDLKRLYGDIGWRGDAADLHLGLTLAHDSLGNPGATPVQALNANLSNIFTAPNAVDNQYAGVNLNGTWRLSHAVSVQAVAYGQTLTQSVPNGITAQVAPCDDGTGLLCNDDGTHVTTTGGKLVADFLDGATYSGLSSQRLVTHAYGASVQVTDIAALVGHANRSVAGAAYDGSDSVFAGEQLIGGFDPYSREFIGPGVVQDQPGKGVNPVRVLSVTRAWGVFADDVLTLARGLDLTLAGRFNDAQIDLEDQLGGPVNGAHDFSRFDPSAGLAWRVAPWLTLHGGYAQTNRAPTPQELSCASPANPCSLLNFFVGDPNLRQVVARTFEGGAQGRIDGPWRGRLSWSADYFHTANTNDIIFEATAYNPNLAFYANAGSTLRQGVEAELGYTTRTLRATLGYAYVDATFRSALLLDSRSNPGADANGQIQVAPGDRIPGVPRHRATLLLTWTPTDRWTLGLSGAAQSAVYRFGDEANLQKPVGGYAVLDLNAAYRVSRAVTLFALVNNVLNTRYDTYGAFGPVEAVPWPNVPGGVTDPRTASPGQPISAYGGVRLSF